jgi:Protein of unknown function (DUF4238)
MTIQLPRKHHYVPEFLLTRWVDSDNKLERYTSPYNGIVVAKRCFPSETGFKRDLYTMNLRKEIGRQYLEKDFFSLVDNYAAKFLDKFTITDRKYIKIAPNRHWALFILTMLHRPPYYFEQYRKVADKIMENQRFELRDRWIKEVGSQRMNEFDQYFNNRSYDDMVETLIEISPAIFSNKNIIDYMMKMSWLILPANQNCYNLVVSDEYIVRTDGVKRPDGHLAMAISPKAMGVYPLRIRESVF